MACSLRQTAHCLLLSLGFLSRLAPALVASDREMARAFALFPLAGLMVAAVSALPLLLPLSSPLALAFCTLAFNLWLTRALHVDGLADTLDALGSMKTGEAFHAVRKDSRIGAFGALGIGLYLAGSLGLLSEIIALGKIEAYFCALAAGRCIPTLLAALAHPHSSSTLGKLLAPTPFSILLALVVGVTCLCLCLTLPACALSFLACLAFLLYLRRLSALHGGYSGDFMGFAILGAELLVLVSALA